VKPVSSPNPAVAVSTPPARAGVLRLVGARYQLINEIGHGGMGSVHRALDRVTGSVVTLKRLRVGSPEPTSRDSREDRLMLAQEFRLLASLRHPNIVSVLAYGFDEEHQPYFTMDLEEGARTITEAGSGKPLALQVELLVQTLRALGYLHRHGVIHRDLKPENILVVRDQVKVLDFGLSIHTADREQAGWAGTLLYMAPEVIGGESPSERCDLYALGMIAYELLAGGYPFLGADPLALSQQIVSTPLPRPADALDARLRPILERLLQKRPENRYADASEVITAFAAALDLPLVDETVVTRESFLQSAPLVGRDEDLARLVSGVRAALNGRGSASLVAGESGVGKSRLLDELRIEALVEGLVVVRGQAMRDGGGPYHLWREVVSDLVLRTDLTDAEARVLKAVAPDVGALLGRAVDDAPGLDLDAAQLRLLVGLEQLLRQQREPVLVIVEDLQWAGSESLKVFGRLAEIVEQLPVMLVGSYRDDEAPRLGESFRDVPVLRLRRLDARATATLVESMVGPGARQPELGQLVERETEGIPFFIVEVVRALAESAGGLARIGTSRLPKRVISGGMRKVVSRRLERVPPAALDALRTAAVIGRAIDAHLVLAICPDLDLDAWLMSCAEAGVLEVRDQKWRFAHDKLREQVLENLSLPVRRALHRGVAEAIEREYPGHAEYVTALAHHWHEAAEPAREAEYAYRAGVLALQSGACREAIVHLRRALEVQGALEPAAARHDRRSRRSWRFSLLDPNAGLDPDSAEFRLGMVESWLTEAHFRLGDLAATGEHAESALRHFGQYVPSRRLGWILDTARQAARRGLQTLAGPHPADPVRSRRVATEIARVQGRIFETSYYSMRALPMVWSVLRQMNHCQPAGPEPDLAQAYFLFASIAGVMGGAWSAERWARRALEMMERSGSPRDVAWMLSRTGAYNLAQCRWDQADGILARAIEKANDLGDLRLWAECHAEIGAVSHYSGRFERGLRLYGDTEGLSRRSGNQQIECWALLGQADLLLRLGRTTEALRLYEEGSRRIEVDAMQSESIWAFGMSALGRLRTGDEAGAYDAADRALSYIVRAAPVAYWTQQGMAATAEVFLTLLETRPNAESAPQLMKRAEVACRKLRQFARHFPLGRPHSYLWSGLLEWLWRRPHRALRLWQRAIDTAEALRTPYERGRAHLEIGRHLGVEASERRYHLHHAAELFEKLGATVDLARARAELERGPFDSRPPGPA
jgi:tetratricopeptide (TPR) repeat protein